MHKRCNAIGPQENAVAEKKVLFCNIFPEDNYRISNFSWIIKKFCNYCLAI